MSNKRSSTVLSSQAYAHILGSNRLRRLLLPQGLASSPYEILDYRSLLTLHDGRGVRSTFERVQRIRFLQDGVAAILDHYWGDGVLGVLYENDAGRLEDSFRDGECHHLVIALPRPMRRGEVLTFRVVRVVMLEFIGSNEWVDTVIDHPVHRLSRTVVFPVERPCRRAEVSLGDGWMPLRVVKLADGRTVLGVDLWQPRAETPYRITWSW